MKLKCKGTVGEREHKVNRSRKLKISRRLWELRGRSEDMNDDDIKLLRASRKQRHNFWIRVEAMPIDSND